MSDRALWAAVLHQAISDAVCPVFGGNLDKYRDQREALEWLNPANPDFKEVCFLAELDPDAVFDGFCRMSGKIELVVLTPENAVREARRIQREANERASLAAKRQRNAERARRQTDEPERIERLAAARATPKPAPMPTPERAPKSPTVYTLGGVTMTAAQWAAQAGVTANAMRSRLRNGWPLEKALTAPINTGKGNLLPHRTYAAFGVERPINEWCELVGIKKGTITSRLSQGMTLEEALTTPVTPRAAKPSTSKEPAIA